MHTSFQLALAFLIVVVSKSEELSQALGNRMKEIKFGSGEAGASSFHSNPWRPEMAFKHNIRVGKGWHTGYVEGRANPLPVMIWYDFKSESFRPAEMSFQPAQEHRNVERAPSSFQFVGSNDVVVRRFRDLDRPL